MTKPQWLCLAKNQSGEDCQLLHGHKGLHEHDDGRGAKTSWNYSDPSRPIADSELHRFK